MWKKLANKLKYTKNKFQVYTDTLSEVSERDIRDSYVDNYYVDNDNREVAIMNSVNSLLWKSSLIGAVSGAMVSIVTLYLFRPRY